MSKGFTAIFSLQINAPVAKVWEALTTPDTIQKYFFDTRTESNWIVGSPIYFRGTWEGKEYEDKGTILAIEPNVLLRYSYWSSFSGKEDTPENYANISYELNPKDGGTYLTINQEGLDSPEQKTHSEQNWKLVMEGMKALVEQG